VKPLPLLSEHPRSIQILLAIVVPAVYGLVTGYFLGVNESVYLVLSVIGIVGALGAGFDHYGARSGAGRGVLIGAIFGASILIAHEIHGEEATAHLPEPAILLIVITTVLAMGFAALGGWLRGRVERREEAAASMGSGPAAPGGPVEEAVAAAPVAEANPSAPVPSPTAPAPTRPAPAPQPTEPAREPTPAAAPAGGQVSLNSGSFEDYRGLGMSVTQAKRVVAYREQLQGGYSSLDDLDRVPGFPKQFLAELKQRLTV